MEETVLGAIGLIIVGLAIGGLTGALILQIKDGIVARRNRHKPKIYRHGRKR